MKLKKNQSWSTAKKQLNSGLDIAAASLVGLAIFGAVAYNSFRPKPPAESAPVTAESRDDNVNSAALAAMRLARSDLRSEHYAARVSGSAGSFYPRRSGVYDSSGEIIYSEDTVINQLKKKSPERSRAMVARYLYGDADSQSFTGYLRRVGADSGSGTAEGCSITVSLRPELEEDIFMLLRYNNILGGCIIQDIESGAIEVMTATSTAGIDSEPSGLTQLEANISGKLFSTLGVTAEEAAEYFDYRSSFKRSDDPEKGAVVENYCFSTDFGLLSEPVDNNGEPVPEAEAGSAPLDSGFISPIHLTSIMQRIFSGTVSDPHILEAVTDSSGEEILLPERVTADLPEGFADSCLEKLSTLTTSRGKAVYIMNDGSGVKYVSGLIETKDGKRKAFTLYSQEDERITLLMPCAVYFIAESEEVS